MLWSFSMPLLPQDSCKTPYGKKLETSFSWKLGGALDGRISEEL